MAGWEKSISDYEKQRLKNLEENRRILESIRQEQLYELKKLYQPDKAKTKRVTSDDPTSPPTKQLRKSLPTKNVRKKPRPVEREETDSNENYIPDDFEYRRKSARLCGKEPLFSFKDAMDEGVQDDDDEDFKITKRKSVSSGPRQKIIIPKNRPNHYGAVPGVEVGRFWETRMACCADGIHRPTVAGIHAGPEGAYSVALSGGYEDDVDLGDCFTYTGEGGRELKGTKSNPKNLRTAPQSKDQTLTRGNLALSLNVTTRNPVRVIRGYKLDSQFAPETGYRYDGLYTIEKFWSCTGIAGFLVYKFAFRRCLDQDPPPWDPNFVPRPLPELAGSADEVSDIEDTEDDEAEKKPQVLQVKLFSK